MAILAVPNISEGRDPDRVTRLAGAFSEGVELLDTHFDAVHNRSVFTLAGGTEGITAALLRGAATAIDEIDMGAHEGVHPCIGALDVCPLVWHEDAARPDAEGAARAVAASLGELGIPVFLYGEMATSRERRERAFFRHGGLAELGRRMAAGEL